MYLQLAEEENDIREFYIPCRNQKTGEITYVREDMLDNLPDHVYDRIMQEAEYMESTGMAEGLSSKADRQARRAERKAAKTEKKRSKNLIKQARAKKISGDTEAAKDGEEEETTPGKVTVFDKILGGVTSIFGGKGGQAATQPGATTEGKSDNTIWYVLGAAAVVGTGLLIYNSNKPKGRRRSR